MVLQDGDRQRKATRKRGASVRRGIEPGTQQTRTQRGRQAGTRQAQQPTKVKLSEADLERYGTQLLENDGWRALKTDPVSRREWGKGFGELGMADYLYIRYACLSRLEDRAEKNDVLWIEWKRLKGKVQANQTIWIRAEMSRGALVWLAGVDFEATPEGFFAHYKASGLCRKIIK